MMSRSPSRRVVITGLGLISPLGSTADELWAGLVQGKSAVGPLQAFDAQALPTSFAAEARKFTGDVADFGTLEGDRKKAVRKGLKVMCRECQMGVAAALRAIENSGLTEGQFDPERAGVDFGSDYMLTEPEEFTSGMRLCAGEAHKFEMGRWGGEGMRQVTPLWLLKYLPNMPACHIAIYWDLRGPNNSHTLREASSNIAIGEALRTIVRASADVMIAGATGTRVHLMRTVQLVQQEEVAGNGGEPAQVSRPFDRDRRGMALGEGAGAVVLEELEFARARGANILAEVVGFGSSSVASRGFIAQRGQALQNSMQMALRDAGISPADVGHVHAHGLSTRSCDREEAQAIRAVFGDRADEVPVVAAKSNFGNLGAGGGAVELIASVLALRAGKLFPLLNYENADPECPVRPATSGNERAGKTFLNLNVTPQGQAACLAVRAWE